MNIAFPANRFGIAQLLGDAFDGPNYIAFALGIRRSGFECLQCSRSQHRPGPGAEILGAEFFAGNLPDVLVNIAGIYSTPLAIIIDVLKQLVARQILATLDDPGQAPVTDIESMLDAALA